MISARVCGRACAAGLLALSLWSAPPVRADTVEIDVVGTSFYYGGMMNMNIELILHPGDTVRWRWLNGYHNVVSGFPEDPNAGQMFYSGPPTSAPGTVFEYTFNDPGYFGYHCHPHEGVGMISAVTVAPEPSTLALLLVGGLALVRRRRHCR